MATHADIPAGLPGAVDHGRRRLAKFVDRWIYVFMAALFVVTALAGFVPASVGKVAMMQAGQRPWFPIEAHVHAALMGTWLVLLLAQSWLMATGRRALHWKLGVAAFALAPAMVVAGLLLVLATQDQIAAALASMPPGKLRSTLEAGVRSGNNIVLAQIRMGLVFSIVLGWALVVRRSSPDTHKRLVFLATAALLPPAFARIVFLPNTMPDSYLGQDAYTLLWLSPMFVWDLYRRRRVHRAYLIWLGVFVPLGIVLHSAWGTEAWLDLAPKILGAG